MRSLGTGIFSKFFGGKMKIFNKGWHRKVKNKKNRRMRSLGARIFSKFFGGKIKNLDMGYRKSNFRQSRPFLENF